MTLPASKKTDAIGRYELLRHLATGGMAEIHLARARGIEGFEKLVVVKTLIPGREHDPALVSMFLDEARMAATLHHPNIVQVYDIGVTGQDEYFFTMEFVYGQDLSHLLRRAAQIRRPLTLDQALTIVLGLCAGLHYAHEKEGPDGRPLGLVHRDVSPQNVLISYDGAVKIMDFGIAKAATSSQKTRDGTLKGKIAYMSPEQATSSAALDRRSDVFSLGIMLWELTTFRRLYKAESDFESLRRIIQTDAPKPSKYRPEYPPELERIVMKALRRSRDERYQSVEEMQLDLEAFARDRKLMISPVSLARCVRELFTDRVEAWAIAQREGRSFAEFLVDTPSLREGTSVTADTWVAPASDASAFVEGEPDLLEIAVEPPPAPRRKRMWPAALAFVAVAATGVAVWQLSSEDDQPATSADSAAPASADQPTAEPSSPNTVPMTATPSPEPVATDLATAPPPTVEAPAATTDAGSSAAAGSGSAQPATVTAAKTKGVVKKPAVKRVVKPAKTTQPPVVKPKPKKDLDSPYPE